MKTRTFYKGLLFLLHCHLQPVVNLSEGYGSSLMTAVNACWQLYLKAVWCWASSWALAHSFPERICQIGIILTLNFWLNTKKVHECGYESAGCSTRGIGVIPDLGWSRYLRLHGCFSLGFPELGNNVVKMLYNSTVSTLSCQSPPYAFCTLSPALVALSRCLSSWTLRHMHCTNCRLDAVFLFFLI